MCVKTVSTNARYTIHLFIFLHFCVLQLFVNYLIIFVLIYLECDPDEICIKCNGHTTIYRKTDDMIMDSQVMDGIDSNNQKIDKLINLIKNNNNNNNNNNKSMKRKYKTIINERTKKKKINEYVDIINDDMGNEKNGVDGKARLVKKLLMDEQVMMAYMDMDETIKRIVAEENKKMQQRLNNDLFKQYKDLFVMVNQKTSARSNDKTQQQQKGGREYEIKESMLFFSI